jgi:hypothetical membrane protein
MKTKKGIMVLAAAYILVLLVMFVLPLFSVPDYSIIRNTLSELGAQSSPHAWIMNITFVSLAIGSVIAGWAYFEGFTLHRIALVLFGISLVLTALFNNSPVDPDIRYNITEAGFHVYFACTAVLSFTILSIATSLIMERQLERLLAVAAGLSAIILSVLTSESYQLAGVWNRLLFIIPFGWMIFNLRIRDY